MVIIFVHLEQVEVFVGTLVGHGKLGIIIVTNPFSSLELHSIGVILFMFKGREVGKLGRVFGLLAKGMDHESCSWGR